MGQRKSKANKDRTESYNVSNVIVNKESKDQAVAATVPEVITPSTAQQLEPEVEFDSKLIPNWVTAEYFTDILKENVNDFEKITNFKAYPALSAGENYATLMLRISIDMQLNDNTTKNQTFMLKVPHDSEQMKEMMSAMNFFVSENTMYFEVIPEFQQMYKAAGQEVNIAAKSYKFPKDPGCANVLLEDLRPRGYKNANRLVGLDMEHTKLVLKKLAQFHAASACRFEEKGEWIDVLMHGFFTEQSKKMFYPLMAIIQKSFLDNIRNWKDGEKYVEILNTNFSSYVDGFLSSMKYDNDNFNVLNHGDCWSNNILFKYDDITGTVIDAMFVDFQAPKYGSPAQDLYYFLISSVKIDIKLKDFDYFIRYYFDHLIENLQLLKYPKDLPILRELHVQLYNYGLWGLNTTMMTLPIVLLDPTKDATVENLMSPTEDGNKFRHMLYTNPRYINYMNEILPWLHNRGLLENFNFYNKEKPAVETVAIETVAVALETVALDAVNPDSSVSSLVPEWLTEEYFIDILKENVKNFKQIKNFEVSRGTNIGDNYASLMLKADIDVELEDDAIQPVSYMIKIAPFGEQAKQMLDMFGTFKKELTMYKDYIQQFEQLFKAAGKDVTFAPKSFKFTKDPGCDLVLLENLRPLGFQNADRRVGLDMEHTKCTLKKLAEFHAASACVFATKGNYPELLNSGMYSPQMRPIMEQMGATFFNYFMETVKSFEGYEEYEHKLHNISSAFYEHMIEASVIDPNNFNVLNHGDCWTNNIMFKYDNNGKIIDTYLVDYQIVQYGTPAQDLYYFLISSPSLDIKLEHFDYFLRFYHAQLIKNLELLKYPKEMPSLKQLHVDMFKFCGWGLGTVFGVMCAVLLDPTENAQIENIFSEDAAGIEMKRQMFSNPRYIRHAERIMTWLNRRGALDYGTLDEPAAPLA